MNGYNSEFECCEEFSMISVSFILVLVISLIIMALRVGVESENKAFCRA